MMEASTKRNYPHRHSRLIRALGAPGRRLVVDRELRVGLGATLAVGVALLGASTLPMWMLALGPILLGVPHVLGDLRYLVVRRGLHRRKALIVLAGGPLLAAAATATVLPALLGCAGALLVARTTPTRRFVGLAIVSALVAAAIEAGWWADLVFAHAHNLVAVLLWLTWRPRRGRWHWLPVVAYGLALAALALGWTDPLLEASGGLWTAWEGLDVDTMQWSLAGPLDPDLGLRLVLTFAFAQSIHYAVWLRLVPEEDRARPTPRTFRASWHALYRDLGPVVLGLAGVAALGVALWALVGLADARMGYLRMAITHGHLELVALALLFTEGRPGSRDGASEAAAQRG